MQRLLHCFCITDLLNSNAVCQHDAAFLQLVLLVTCKLLWSRLALPEQVGLPFGVVLWTDKSSEVLMVKQ